MYINSLKFLRISIIFSFGACHGQQELTDLQFLLGTWKIAEKDTYEAWDPGEHGQLRGKSYKPNEAGDTLVLETLQISVKNSEVVYEATVSGQNEGQTIGFTLNKAIRGRYSFENDAHDFPKKIQYEKTGDNKLFVRVLGEEGKGFYYDLIRKK